MRFVAMTEHPGLRPSRRPVDVEMLAAARAALGGIGTRPRAAGRVSFTNHDTGISAMVRVLSATVVVALVAAGVALTRISDPAAAATCPAITYTFPPDAPSALVHEADVAFASVGAIAGLRFVRSGPGEGPAIVVDWSDVGELGVDSVSGSRYAGRAEGTWTTASDGTRRLAGTIHIDGSVAARPGFAFADESGAVLLHEIGHVLGLPHGSDPTAVMYPRTRSAPVRWSPSEIDALRAIGRSNGCAA